MHECKIKVDGITKYIEDHEFFFDNSFSEKESTEDVYNYTIDPLIEMLLNKGIVTCFAYGQTGSGKTYTMVIFNIFFINFLINNRKEYRILLLILYLALRNIAVKILIFIYRFLKYMEEDYLIY